MSVKGKCAQRHLGARAIPGIVTRGADHRTPVGRPARASTRMVTTDAPAPPKGVDQG